MAKERLTENKAEQTPTGGVLVGKRNGQTMIHNKGSLSGYLVGKTHAEGGIQAVNEATGQALEMQGGEVVITAPAVSDQTKREFEGKMLTNRQILSEINSRGGGVSFAEGGDIPKSLKYTGASYMYGGKTMSDHDIFMHINGGHLAKGKTLKQIAKLHGTTLLDINKQVKMGLKAESEHTSSKREQLKIVKDHLVENPEYYTILKKAGLKKGGQLKENLVKDSEKGNTPARDLNNYNDVLDLGADGTVGGDNGLAMANGGDLSDIDSYFDLGGGVGLPKVAYVKVSNAGTSLNGLIFNKYNSYIEFVESVEYAYKQLGRDVRSFVELTAFDENDTKLIECSTYISNQKNTIKNFNPLTGNYKNLEKSLSNSRPINFKKYDWQDWLLSKVKPSTSTGQTNTQALSQNVSSNKDNKVKKILLKTSRLGKADDWMLLDTVFKLLKAELNLTDFSKDTLDISFLNKNKEKLTDTAITKIKTGGNYFSQAIFVIGENTTHKEFCNGVFETFPDLDFTGILDNQELGWYADFAAKFLTNIANQSQTQALSVKFTQGEIMMFEVIRNYCIMNDLKVGDYDFIKTAKTDTLYFKNLENSETYELIKFGNGVGYEKYNKKSKEIIEKYLEWEKDNASSTSQPTQSTPINNSKILQISKNVSKDNKIESIVSFDSKKGDGDTYNLLRSLWRAIYNVANLSNGNGIDDFVSFYFKNNNGDQISDEKSIFNGSTHKALFVNDKTTKEDFFMALFETFPELDFTSLLSTDFERELYEIFKKSISSTKNSVQSSQFKLLTDLSNTKIWIGDNPELSKRVQERAFELGWNWMGIEKTRDVKEKWLMFGSSKNIYSGNSKGIFNAGIETEIFADDLFGSSTAQTSSGYFTQGEIDMFGQMLKYMTKEGLVFKEDGLDRDSNSTIAEFVLYEPNKPNKLFTFLNDSYQLSYERGSAENEFMFDKFVKWFNETKKGNIPVASQPTNAKLGIVDGFNLEFVISTGSVVSLEYYTVSELLQKIVSVYDTYGINLIYLKLVVEGQIMNTTAESFLIGKTVNNKIDKEINTDTISSKELLLKLERLYPNFDFSKMDEELKPKSQSSQTNVPLTAEQKLANEFVADDSQLRKNDILGSGGLQQDRNDLDALATLLPAFQEIKFAVEKSSILKEMFRIQKKIAYKGFIASNEEVSKGSDLFTPQGLLNYYFTQTTQNPTAELQPACELPTPNGAKSKLPMSAYLNVRSPQFKKWFGDWEKAYETDNYVNCSKMIDEETKEPKIYFHGVRKYIPSFGQMSNMGSGVVRPYGSFEPPNFPASYFADNESYANFYGGIAENMPKPSPDYKPFIYKVFLSVKNPISLLPLDFEVSYRDLIDYVLVAYGVRLNVNQVLLKQLENDMDKKRPMWVYIRRDIGLIETLKDYGYDALIQQGDIPVFDNNGEVVADRSKFIKDTEYLSFYPDQVKSATVKKSFYFNFFNDIRFKKGGYVRI